MLESIENNIQVLIPATNKAERSLGREFSKLSSIRSIIEIVGSWAFIVGIILVYICCHNPALYIIALFLIASRQYALMILMHDAFHTLLHPNRKINHFIGSVLLAYPCGSAYWVARNSHLAHHRTLGKAEDPDRDLYIARGKESLKKLLLFFITFPLSEQIKRTYGMTPSSNSSIKKSFNLSCLYSEKVLYMLPVCFFQLVIIGVFYWAGTILSYFTLWVLPLLLAAVFNGIRIFCEHGNISDIPGEKEDRSISIISNPFERFFIAPFHMNYHAEHHLFPYVPHYNLPQLRTKIHAFPKLDESIQWRKGYVAFLLFFLRENSTTKRLMI